jgi:hypothetical protein
MNGRIKTLWLPSLANLAAAAALMLLFPILGALAGLLAKCAHGSFAQRLIAGLTP